MSHELAATVTDPLVGLATVTGPPLAWYDNTNGEIGDICNAQQGNYVGADGQTYTVQLYFSNQQNNCVPPPVVLLSDFSMAASPSSLTVNAGQSASVTISTTATWGSDSVSLAVSGVPPGATATLSPTSVTTGGSSTLTVAAGTAAAGTYTLTVTGTGSSATHSTSVALTVISTVTIFGITNGGFESGLTGWTSTGTTASVSTAHSGSFAAQVGGTSPTNGDSSLAQTFTVPAAGGTLSFWYQVHCPDTVRYDWAAARLKDNVTGVTIALLTNTCTNTGAWVQVSHAVTASHSVTLTLVSHDDNYAGDPTYTLYDDVIVK